MEDKFSHLSRKGDPVPRGVINQIMKPKDWVKLGILIIIFVVCWVWVTRVYNTSLGHDDYVNEILAESNVGG